MTGNSTTISDCKALDCRADGFDIDVTCDSITVDGCTAIGCGAEGLDNSGGAIATSVRNCLFSKCRIDFAGNGTLAQDLNNKFKSGGPSKAPEID